MKKLFLFALMAMLYTACGDGSKKEKADALAETADSLTTANDQLEREIDELLGIINDVEQGFNEINEAQGRVVIDRRGEGANQRARIQENMQFIQETLAQNRELIDKLKKRLDDSSLKSEQLRRTIENMMGQLEQKTNEVQELRAELEAKNIHIAELDEQVAALSEDVTALNENIGSLQNENAQQDQQLHAAWYAVGSKNELKDHHILKSGHVLQGSFDASFFTQIDIRQFSTLNLYSKKAEMLTTHPEGSYALERDENRQYVLRILDPKQFWSTSKYLVIQTK